MGVMDKETNIDIKTGMHGVGTLKAPATITTTQDMYLLTNRQACPSYQVCLVRIRMQSARHSLCITRIPVGSGHSPALDRFRELAAAALSWAHFTFTVTQPTRRARPRPVAFEH
jgi:hypothetical protein